MPDKVTASELRASIHHVLQEKEEKLSALRQRHESAVSELYGLLSRKRDHGSAFPSIDLEDVEAETSFESLEDWKRSNKLDIKSANADSLRLPSLPPPSPPPGVTVFPDEPADDAVPLNQPKEEPAPSPSVAAPRRTAPARSTPAAIVPPTFSPAILTNEPVAGPSRVTRSPTPTATVAMSEVQPRSRRVYSPSLPPTVPDWIPLPNYAVAETAPSTPPHILMPLESDYAAKLPQLPPIPNRSAHRRKRKDSKSDEGPADLYKLQASYEINPVSGSLSKSSKIVLTSDWRVALAEMRHIRAMERIEQKKENGRWSLRQPKKLKAPPVRKAHWDYLLEEMEWMRLDFAEERRWKRVLAREFAYQIVEWHLSTPADKAAMMVGEQGWGAHKREERLPHAADPDDIDMGEPEAPTDNRFDDHETGAEVLEEMLPRRGKRGRGRPKKPVIDDDDEPEEAVEQVEQVEANAIKAEAMVTTPAVKSDEPAEIGAGAIAVDGSGPVAADHDAEGEADAEGEIDDGEGSADIVDGVIGLEEIASNRDNATDPDADAEGEVEAEPEAVPETALTATPRGVRLPNGLILSERFKGPEQLSLIRAPLLDSALESGLADMPSLETQITLANGPLEDDRPLTLEELFPDLAPYAGPAPPDGQQSPKRLEEGHMPHHRPAHTSRIMDLEPMFISMLQPGKTTIDGSWDLHDGPWYEDPKGSTDMTPEAVAATSSIFHGRAARLPAPYQYVVPKPAAHHLRPVLVWTPEEDDCLKRLVSMYPFNWQLIADSFNSEVVTIPTEKRLPYDCFERWDFNFGPDAERKKALAAAAAAQAVSVPNTAATGNTTPAVPSGGVTPAVGQSSAGPPPTPGTANAAGTPAPGQVNSEQSTDAPPPPGLSKREAKAAARNKYEGTKKAIRHQALYDSVRRVIRRRDTSKQKSNTNPKQVINIHESHSTYLSMPILDPSTLSNQKHQADVQRQIQQQQHMQRTQYMQDQQHRQRINQAAMAQAASQQQQGRPVAPAPPGQPMPPQGQGQGQPQPPRMGPNGQPLPPNMNMNSNQQMILGAVAAATAANRQNGSATPGGTARPPAPQQVRAPSVQQGGQQVPMQQMQHVEAQMLAAQMMQARAQQAQDQRAAGTPMPQIGTLAGTPYQTVPELADMMPNGQQHMHVQTSPAAMTNANMHSSPQSQAQAQAQAQGHARAATMPMASTPHLRASSSGSPQMGNTAPQPNPVGLPQQLNPQQQLMNQIVAQITAAGGQPTTENVRQHMQQYMRTFQAQAAQNQQQQQQQQAQMGTPQGPPQMGTPQMAMQGVPHFARSPSVSQGQVRHSPSQ